MKINFNGHTSSTRETELSQQELSLLFEVMKQKFLDHIEYGKFNYSFPSKDQLAVTKLCDDHQVDVDYEKDRVAFFTSIIEQMENPYV
jgi:hypothetical protein